MDRTTRGEKPGLLVRLGLRRQGKTATGAGARADMGSQSLRIVNPYHAVSVQPCLMACERIRPLTGKRYLSREAPALPVSGCTNRQCRCRYVHHDDRRADERRVIGEGRAGLPAYGGPERRLVRRGRRASD